MPNFASYRVVNLMPIWAIIFIVLIRQLYLLNYSSYTLLNRYAISTKSIPITCTKFKRNLLFA